MNKILLTFTSALLVVHLFAQDISISRSVFASGGLSSTNEDISLSYTMGQSGLVGSYTNEDIVINVGFQQHDFLETYIDKIKQDNIIRIFPNPFYDLFYLNIESQHEGEIAYFIYDSKGRIILRKDATLMKNDINVEGVDLSKYNPGIYHLRLFFYPEKRSIEQYSFKLIKQ